MKQNNMNSLSHGKRTGRWAAGCIRFAFRAILCLCSLTSFAQEQGCYFYKKTYTKEVLPTFADVSEKLPEPVMKEHPLWIETYWKAWELAFGNLHTPTVFNGFVSPYFDAAFNNCIFLWDMSFITFFTGYGYPWVPAITSLDNFYAKQHPTGEICRQIYRHDGTDAQYINRYNEPLYSRYGYEAFFSPDKHQDDICEKTPVIYVGRDAPVPNPLVTLDGLNHPILAWAEWENFRLTGNKTRLRQVYLPLVKYYGALQKYLRQGNGLYMTDWASMDNATRNKYLKGGGTGIDISCEMALFARCLAGMAAVLHKPDEALNYQAEADTLKKIINELMWDPATGFYYDLTLDERQIKIKTVAAFWSLLAEVPSKAQAEQLVAQLNNPLTFGRKNKVPTLAADEAGYESLGGYWRGAVWAPTTTMIVAGLEKNGYGELARQIALNHLNLVADVFKETGTIWEAYAPDSATHAYLPGGKHAVKKDFVGWSGIGPVKFLLEYGVGLKPDAAASKLEWNLYASDDTGCNRYVFNDIHVNLLARQEKNGTREVTVESDRDFQLDIHYRGARYSFPVRPGKQTFSVGKKRSR
ncbi:MAG: hypothetical protein LBP50_01090 [Tannerella sp.]|jgi:hypothetical protein|nr:hypothetical protein [Tannerella sp.]